MIVFHRLVCISKLVNIYSIIPYTLCYYTIFPTPFDNLATFNLRIEPLNTRNLHFMFILPNGNGLYRFLCHLQKRRTIFIISMSHSQHPLPYNIWFYYFCKYTRNCWYSSMVFELNFSTVLGSNL